MFNKFGVALNQRSTWAGLVWILTAAGLGITQDQASAIEAAGLAVAGLLGVFWKD